MRIARSGSRAELWVLGAACLAAGVLALPSRDLATAAGSVPALEAPAFFARTYQLGPDDCRATPRASVLVTSGRLWIHRAGDTVSIDDLDGRRDWPAYSRLLAELHRQTDRRDVELAAAGAARYADLLEATSRARAIGLDELVVLSPDNLAVDLQALAADAALPRAGGRPDERGK